MPEVPTASYDEVPYSDYVFPYTHPASVAAVAALFGMRPADPARCRVLELGCWSGANLIPMACDLPGSEFVGIDLSPRQIDHGRRAVAALGLTNIDLRPGSILDVDDRFGRFDYIVCHGVYSWVPAEVREGILAVCKANLAADGVAYVSYNTYRSAAQGSARARPALSWRFWREPSAPATRSTAVCCGGRQICSTRRPTQTFITTTWRR